MEGKTDRPTEVERYQEGEKEQTQASGALGRAGFYPRSGGGRSSEPGRRPGSGVRPGDIVNEVGLQQEFSTREQVLCDEILVGAYGHAIAYTQGTQHLQHLCNKVRDWGGMPGSPTPAENRR